MEKLTLIFGCGTTNVRVIAIKAEGEIVTSKSNPNQTREDSDFTGW